MTTHYFSYDEEGAVFFKTIKDLLNSPARKEDMYVYEGELDEENYDDDADDYREVNALSYLIEDYHKIKGEVKEYENIKTHDTLAFFNPPAAKLYEKLKEQLNTIFPSKTEQAVISKYQVQRTNNLRTIKKLKEEIKELKEGIINSLKGENINENTDHLIDTIADVVNENEKLKEEVKKYRTYHGDKCNECEEQRERADFNEKEIKQLKEEVETWEECSSYENPNDVRNEIDRLSEIEDCIWCDLWGYDCVEDDTKLYRLQADFKEFKELKEENKKLKNGLHKCLEVMRMTEEEMKLNKLSE